jgi:carbonic anhydrase
MRHAVEVGAPRCLALDARSRIFVPMSKPEDTQQAFVTRRRFVTTTTLGSAAAMIGLVDVPRAPLPALLPPPCTADDALARLMAGNGRFVSKTMTSFNDDLAILKQNTVDKQEPFAAVLSCADSRVPVELVFDQTIGHIFVTRVAGNVASAEIIASLEYGVAVLGTKVIMVMGHAGCGAVKAAIGGKAVPGQISTLYRFIRPAIDQAGSDLNAAIRANAVIQARLLRESSPVIAEAIQQSTLRVVASHYDLGTGTVTVLS